MQSSVHETQQLYTLLSGMREQDSLKTRNTRDTRVQECVKPQTISQKSAEEKSVTYSTKEQVLDHSNHSKDNSPSELSTELLIHPVEVKESLRLALLI
ncbi:hypothetical protein M8J75_002313 [Diaphorina citri]|nr:hypothetical protein M8J75_002313 [Diaphorina citri]